MLALAAAPAVAQDPAPASAEEVRQLREEVRELRKALEEQQKILVRLTANAEAPRVEAAPPPAAPAREERAPLSFRIGAADFTPGGFADFTALYRSTNAGNGIGTAFGSIPFPNTPAGRLSEMRFSAQNSRLSLKVTSKVGRQHVTGYVESDFLGALPGGAHVTSNANTFRMRLYWVDVRRGKWEVLGGQAWSLMTPNRSGLSPAPSDLFISMDMDTNYQVGLTWARTPQFRTVYHASGSWTAGVSLENPQQYIGAATVLPSPFYAGQLDAGGNTAAPNAHPDVIGKIAYDGQAGGRALHVESAGLFRGFRIATPDGGISWARGWSGSLNTNLEVVKNFRLIADTFYGRGGGRYLFGLGPDVVVLPGGDLSPVRAAGGIAGFEYQATPASMWYGYYGTANFGRNYGVMGQGRYAGFGFPGSPDSANRSIQETSLGLIRTFWKDPAFGALQLISQYAYVTRSPWWVAPGAPANAHSHMVWANLRYVLP